MFRVPRISLTLLGLSLLALSAAAQQSPMIASTSPAIGARDVDPATTEITVTFDQDMSNAGWSWTGGGPQYPTITARPMWRDARTCVLPVSLEPGHFYRVGVNSRSHRNFQSARGVPTPARVIYFCTEGASEADLAALTPPKPVEMTVTPGDMNVDPSITEIRITFDQPMSGGRSITGGGDTFPPIPEGGEIQWTEDMKTIFWPVALEPNHEYYFGINSFSHTNFRSDHGVPAEWTRVSFKTSAGG